jgi:DNA-binding transcriptional LysR family regulator
MLAVAAGHPLASSSDVELQALREATLVDLPAGWGIRMAVDRSFAAAGLTRTITYEVNDTATMVEFISTTRQRPAAPSLVDTGDDIALVPIRHHPPEFQTAIAVPTNRRLSAATRAMLATIERSAGRPRPI